MKKRAPTGVPRKWLLDHRDWRSDECLEWPFGRRGTGYAQISWNGYPSTAHRIMCILVHGDPLPGQVEVAHKCGNKICVNPRHLRHATWQENCADKIEHGRENFGERNGQAKLTEAQALEAIRLYQTKLFTQKEIGVLFGVRDSAICRIVTGKRWPHLMDKAA